ncbi:MAG: T9SS type A sorting domain-containing protein [Ferruginibacter sp.]
MATLRCLCTAALILLLYSTNTKAQTIYFPAGSSRLLKETAVDMASLLQKAITGSHFDTSQYNNFPAAGIVLQYDSTIIDNQLCKLISGPGRLVFKAAQDNGLVFGVYRYLKDLGFNFYQPGTIWEQIPNLNSAFLNVNKDYNCRYKYKTWAVSGGHNRWAMDATNDFNWDIYFGENGHNWALYQRRNGMIGSQRFTGHRGDILTGNFISALQSNPCNVACYNGLRLANTQSVPDVNSTAAMELWENAIEQRFTQYSTIVNGNRNLYADLYHNLNYYQANVGIEVPDGAQWTNSKDNLACNQAIIKTPADQHTILCNYTHEKINLLYPGIHSQAYAYSSHANVPSANLLLNNNIDVQVVPTAFQSESSPVGLLNRWYKSHTNISEYHYLNIPQWGGETPLSSFRELKQTLQRLKEQHSQGIIWEASPAKFASLPFLKAANDNLLDDTNPDSSIADFCDKLFGAASGSVNNLLKQWSNETTITTGSSIADNKYKIPLYLQLLRDALQQASSEPPVVQQRLRELKCYLHYMILYYDWVFDQRSDELKQNKAASLCLFLASIHKLQLVNSYFLILNIASHYATSSSFYQQYNIQNGAAYNHGNLPLITSVQIDALYEQDLSKYAGTVVGYQLLEAETITSKMQVSNISSISKIQVKVAYNNGYESPGRSEFYIKANAAGSFTVAYNPSFNLLDKGNISFTVENTGKAMDVVFDKAISNPTTAGSFTVQLPQGGTYKFSIVSKWQSSVNLEIQTNKNIFYKNTAFLGSKTENYSEVPISLPGYFYVPAGMEKIFFSIHNAYAYGKFVTAVDISNAFRFLDNHNLSPVVKQSDDSTLFYLEVPTGRSGTFWQASAMAQYDLCFANISNILLFAERRNCKNAELNISIRKVGDNCITHLAATSKANSYKWEVSDNGRMLYYSTKEVDLPDYISPSAIITLVADDQCSITKILKQEDNYFLKKEACASGAMLPVNTALPVLFPNPSNGIFYINDAAGAATVAHDITIYDVAGRKVIMQPIGSSINLSHSSPGVFIYKLTVGEKTLTGKLLKL